MEVIAGLGVMSDLIEQHTQALFCGAEVRARIAERIAAGLISVQPELHSACEQSRGYITYFRVRVLFGDAVAQIDRLGGGGIEDIGLDELVSHCGPYVTSAVLRCTGPRARAVQGGYAAFTRVVSAVR